MELKTIHAYAAAGIASLGLWAGAFLWDHYHPQKTDYTPTARIQRQLPKKSMDPIGDLHTKVIKDGTALPLKKKRHQKLCLSC